MERFKTRFSKILLEILLNQIQKAFKDIGDIGSKIKTMRTRKKYIIKL
jgi:hypothetical protein